MKSGLGVFEVPRDLSLLLAFSLGLVGDRDFGQGPCLGVGARF